VPSQNSGTGQRPSLQRKKVSVAADIPDDDSYTSSLLHEVRLLVVQFVSAARPAPHKGSSSSDAEKRVDGRRSGARSASDWLRAGYFPQFFFKTRGPAR
jgi:hypothetical protein